MTMIKKIFYEIQIKPFRLINIQFKSKKELRQFLNQFQSFDIIVYNIVISNIFLEINDIYHATYPKIFLLNLVKIRKTLNSYNSEDNNFLRMGKRPLEA